MRVLLVEDTWIIAQSYAGLLEPLDVTIVGPAARLEDARRLLAENEVDAALVDMNLHGEYAYALIDALAERCVPTVVVTGYEVLPRLEGRVAAVLKKPIRAESLLRALRTIAANRYQSALAS
jgi:DNA-binding NarL/FixJ family response regulator